MKEKTKLEREAIEAFFQKYKELPADAGWPVVKQWNKDVYFARSLQEWKAYKRWQIKMNLLFKVVVILSLTAFGAALLEYYDVVLYCTLIYVLVFACLILSPKKNGSEIRVYDHNEGKIRRIAT